MADNEELQKQAQQKLADARTLIKEAGVLAEAGGFVLHFGEIGSFYPTAAFDPEKYRAEAERLAHEEGRSVYNRSTGGYNVTPFDELNEDEKDDLIDGLIRELKADEFGGSEDAEYAEAGRWWHPSRC